MGQKRVNHKVGPKQVQITDMLFQRSYIMQIVLENYHIGVEDVKVVTK